MRLRHRAAAAIAVAAVGAVATFAILIFLSVREAAREEGLQVECELTDHPLGSSVDYARRDGKDVCVYRDRRGDVVTVRAPDPGP